MLCNHFTLLHDPVFNSFTKSTHFFQEFLDYFFLIHFSPVQDKSMLMKIHYHGKKVSGLISNTIFISFFVFFSSVLINLFVYLLNLFSCFWICSICLITNCITFS